MENRNQIEYILTFNLKMHKALNPVCLKCLKTHIQHGGIVNYASH